MSYKNFKTDSPNRIPGVAWPWTRRGGAGGELPVHGARHQISHWGIGRGFSRYGEVLNPESPLAVEVLGLERKYPEDVLLGVEQLSDRTYYAGIGAFICPDDRQPAPFSWYKG